MIINNLAKLGLLESLVLGSQVANGSYLETFDSDPGWVVSNSSRMYQTNFQGDGVFRVQPNFDLNTASTPHVQEVGSSFILEWDSFLQEPSNVYNIEKSLLFGLWKDPGDIHGTYGIYSIGSNGNDYTYSITSMINGAGRGNGITDINNRWLHNKLIYNHDLPELEFQVYNGKGNTTDLFYSVVRENNMITSAEFMGTNRLGFKGLTPFGSQEDLTAEYPIMYLDNISFNTIPEPSTLFGLGALGLGTLASRKRRNEK